MEVQETNFAMTDEDLAKKAKDGDGRSFVELTHRCQHVVYRLAYRFSGSAEDADDLCQECFIRAFRQMSKYDHRRPFKPWLMRVCSNVCLNWAKQNQRRKAIEEPLLDHEFTDGAESVESNTMGKLEMQAVLRALQELPAETRLLMILRFMQGLTLREISEQSGIKLPTVAFRICKGVEKVRARLSPEWVE